MKKNKIYFLFFLIIIFSSCASMRVVDMTSSKMNKLDLGMSKYQITKILGNSYTIAEKRVEIDKEVEVLSYRDLYRNDEIYLFVLKNGKLEKWYRELVPTERNSGAINNNLMK